MQILKIWGLRSVVEAFCGFGYMGCCYFVFYYMGLAWSGSY